MNKLKRKRRIVEIYFILYLAALVFILPDTSFRPGDGNGNHTTGDFEKGFILIPEKTSLTCKVAIEPNGYRIVGLDSINTIFYTGDFEDVRFEFILQEEEVEHRFTLQSGRTQGSKFFRVIEVPEKKAVQFFWNPKEIEKLNTKYLVRVVATAKSRKSGVMPFEEQYTYQAETKFSLLVVIVNAITGEQSVAQSIDDLRQEQLKNMMNLSNTNGFIGLGKIMLSPSINSITSVAFQQWTNTIYAYNVNLLTDVSELKVNFYPDPKNNGGDAKIEEIKPEYLVVKGKAPSFGRLNVEIFLKRKADGQEARTSFSVIPQQIEKPVFKQFIYPGQTDTIDPRLPIIGSEVKAVIRDGETIRAFSYGGMPIIFTPDLADTGKKLILERFIDNKPYGQSYFIYVIDFPEPRIYDAVIRPQREVELVVHSFGFINRERNEVVQLELDGNVSERWLDLRGRIQDVAANPPYRVQHFLLKPKNPQKPFVFNVVAIDKLGRKSKARNVVAD